MASRMLGVLVATVVTSMFGQVPVSIKAGDRAPDLTWTKIVASTSTSGGPDKLFGHTTVLLFLPPVTHNEQTLSSWNSLVEKFAAKPVNFVWVANENEEAVTPFLKSHPVKGWMVLDSKEESYKAYGVKGAAGVLIDANGIIAGFSFMAPTKDQIQAVLDGRAIAIQGDATEAQLDAIFEGKAVRLESEPFRPPSPPEKPNLPPSENVHISISDAKGTESVTVPAYWIRRGFRLRDVLAEVSNANPGRVVLPATLDEGKRYDFVVVPPHELNGEVIHKRVIGAIQNYFHVTVISESRSTAVYVMTAMAGKTPRAKSEEESYGGGSIAFSTEWQELRLPEGTPLTRKSLEEASRKMMDSQEFRENMAAAHLIAMTATSSSMDDLCRALEDGLHRPIVNETGMDGIYDFKVQGQARTTEEFLDMLRDQLGLVLLPEQRSIEIIVAESR